MYQSIVPPDFEQCLQEHRRLGKKDKGFKRFFKEKNILLFKKTRENVTSGFASLKVCKTNNDNCEKEKNEGFNNVKILQDKLRTLGIKVRI